MDTNEIFEANPSLDCFYHTSDGNAFFTENTAERHATTLEDKTVVFVTRKAVEAVAVNAIEVTGETVAPTSEVDEVLEPVEQTDEPTEEVEKVVEPVEQTDEPTEEVEEVIAPKTKKPKK
ncbi:hypothetical protein QT970_02420 [Microcoleus sp. herbarium8]